MVQSKLRHFLAMLWHSRQQHEVNANREKYGNIFDKIFLMPNALELFGLKDYERKLEVDGVLTFKYMPAR